MNRRDSGERWLANGEVHRLLWDDVEIAVQLRSESGRIDINRAPRELLLGLFRQVLPDAPQEALADAVADWRDADDRPSPQGAERDDYRAAGLSHGPGNRAFRSLHELGQVIGFDADRVNAVSPYLTVHGRRPRVNAMSAELPVLLAVPGMQASVAEAFLVQRESAIAEGSPPPLNLLDSGRRYLEMRLEQAVIAMDIGLRLKDTAPKQEHTVLQIDRNRAYKILAREWKAPAPVEETRLP